MQKLAIISSVQANPFASFDVQGFTDDEIRAAQLSEIELFAGAIGIPNLEKYVKLEVVRALDGMPTDYSADAYILGGSPAMVTERDEKEWIDRLIGFIHSEVDAGKPVFGICFGHQILATAFGSRVGNMDRRVIGAGEVVAGDSKIYQSYWSHKQQVQSLSDEVRAIDERGDGKQMIQVGEHAFGTQFHPEFSPAFTSFLLKRLAPMLKKEGIDVGALIEKVDKQGVNTASKLLEEFVRKYYNI